MSRTIEHVSLTIPCGQIFYAALMKEAAQLPLSDAKARKEALSSVQIDVCRTLTSSLIRNSLYLTHL